MTATDAKSYTMANAGAKNKADAINYFAVDHNWAMENTAEEAAVMDTTKSYAFRNVGSEFFLEAEGAVNGANVSQGNTRESDIWTLQDAGDGYYYLIAQSGLSLDVPYGSADNGTSIGVWTNDNSDARKFKFIDNGDGSYTVTTKVSGDGSCLAVASDSKDLGADVIQWTRNGGDAQKWVPVVKYPLLDGTIITEFDRLDSEHAASWSIEKNLANGALIFGDRDTTYTEIPTALVGAEYVCTACDAKTLNADLATFVAAAGSDIYVAMDARVTGIPAWLGDWEKTSLTMKSDKDVTFVLYKKRVAAGNLVTLGENGQSAGCVNYMVIAVAANTAGDITADGQTNLADVIMLQKYLLASGSITNAKAADLNGDGRVNAIDLTLLKRMLLS